MEARGAAGSAADGDGRPIVLVKLGGSLITDKLSPEEPRTGELTRLAGEIAAVLASPSRPDLLLAHGSGSFGHFAAAGTPLGDRRRRSPGPLDELRAAAAGTQRAAERLHRLVIDALLEAEVPAFSVSPSSLVWYQSGEVRSGSIEPIEGALELGLLPVTYGSVVLDHDRGAAICSTEPLLHHLAIELLEGGRPVDGVLWLGATDGLLDDAGATFPRIDETTVEAALAVAGEAAGIDVTGGMRLRLRTAWRLARRGVPSWILDGRRPGALRDALLGEPGGTEVRCVGA